MKNVLVVAAHPDDEILGCGATIAKLAANGCNVNIAIMAEGLTSRDKNRNVTANKEELNELAQTAKKAAKFIGAKNLELLSLPDNRMDSMDLLDVVKEIESLKNKYKPDTIFTHNSTDVNIDHEIINRAVLTACRPVPGECVKTILSFEVQSSTEWKTPYQFPANWYEDVSDYMEMKLKALEIYESEMREFPHARSIEAVEALGKWRGSNIGCRYSEAFILERNIC